MPSPLAVILGLQSVALVWLLLRARSDRKKLQELSFLLSLVRQLAQCAFSAAWVLTPDDKKALVPPEVREHIDAMARDMDHLGRSIAHLSPSEMVQAVAREAHKHAP